MVCIEPTTSSKTNMLQRTTTTTTNDTEHIQIISNINIKPHFQYFKTSPNLQNIVDEINQRCHYNNHQLQFYLSPQNENTPLKITSKYENDCKEIIPFHAILYITNSYNNNNPFTLLIHLPNISPIQIPSPTTNTVILYNPKTVHVEVISNTHSQPITQQLLTFNLLAIPTTSPSSIIFYSNTTQLETTNTMNILLRIPVEQFLKLFPVELQLLSEENLIFIPVNTSTTNIHDIEFTCAVLRQMVMNYTISTTTTADIIISPQFLLDHYQLLLETCCDILYPLFAHELLLHQPPINLIFAIITNYILQQQYINPNPIPPLCQPYVPDIIFCESQQVVDTAIKKSIEYGVPYCPFDVFVAVSVKYVIDDFVSESNFISFPPCVLTALLGSRNNILMLRNLPLTLYRQFYSDNLIDSSTIIRPLQEFLTPEEWNELQTKLVTSIDEIPLNGIQWARTTSDDDETSEEEQSALELGDAFYLNLLVCPIASTGNINKMFDAGEDFFINWVLRRGELDYERRNNDDVLKMDGFLLPDHFNSKSKDVITRTSNCFHITYQKLITFNREEAETMMKRCQDLQLIPRCQEWAVQRYQAEQNNKSISKRYCAQYLEDNDKLFILCEVVRCRGLILGQNLMEQ
jgi:hypothetical protein